MAAQVRLSISAEETEFNINRQVAALSRANPGVSSAFLWLWWYNVDVPSSPLASSPSSSVYKTARVDARKTGSVGSRPSNSQSNDDLTDSNSDDDNFYDAEEETR